MNGCIKRDERENIFFCRQRNIINTYAIYNLYIEKKYKFFSLDEKKSREPKIQFLEQLKREKQTKRK